MGGLLELVGDLYNAVLSVSMAEGPASSVSPDEHLVAFLNEFVIEASLSGVSRVADDVVALGAARMVGQVLTPETAKDLSEEFDTVELDWKQIETPDRAAVWCLSGKSEDGTPYALRLLYERQIVCAFFSVSGRDLNELLRLFDAHVSRAAKPNSRYEEE